MSDPKVLNDLAFAEQERKAALLTGEKPAGDLEALLRAPVGAGVQLFGTNDPLEALDRAEALVARMQKIVEKARNRYIARIPDDKGNVHDYPKVDWWTSMGFALNLIPRMAGEVQTVREGDFKAIVEIWHVEKQILITRGEGFCSMSEKFKSGRLRWADEYAARAMAQTRAIGRAFRGPLGGLAALAGLEATPAEEMTGVHGRQKPQEAAQQPRGGSGDAAREPEADGALPAPVQTIADALGADGMLDFTAGRIKAKKDWKPSKLGGQDKSLDMAEFPGVKGVTNSNPEDAAHPWGQGTACRAEVAQREDGGLDWWSSEWQGKVYYFVRLLHVRPAAAPAPEKNISKPPSPSAPHDAWHDAAALATNHQDWFNRSGFAAEFDRICAQAGITGKLLAATTSTEQLVKLNDLAETFRQQNTPPATAAEQRAEELGL
ncbi:MAG: hypothetical protein FJ279_02150 [Planctomycetes bacterium]|nr:hypothetical protein [Planctomycetota bacterium]